ncbi:MAG: ACP S-malonyltransferase [Candidatus Auribacterota bacterium]|jgi:[acyl-carrier-protein] S-malonyltransferase|nr:ACP S-malonyltransferase [Candidatus Auribacterota bacterium]
MKKFAFVFPGQGAQYVGMGEGLLYSSCGQDIIQRASDVIGFDLKELCINGPLEMLTRTENSQVALYTLGYIAYALCKNELPCDCEPSYVAGLSLGEFTALAAAGVYTFEDGLRLVQKRGRYMMESCEANPGTMACVMGADRKVVQSLLDSQISDGKLIAMANLNCPGQIVVSGHHEAVDALCVQAEADGLRVARLNVSGAFHSPLMESARVKLADAVNDIPFNDARIPVITNCDAKEKRSAQSIKDAIIKQMVSSVYFEDSVQYMIANGVELFIEPGCGKVLKGLIRRIDRNPVCNTVESQQDVESVAALLCEEVAQ